MDEIIKEEGVVKSSKLLLVAIIVVLFSVQVNERRYSEWERGIQNKFREVRIICL